jgi:hypothetical protein
MKKPVEQRIKEYMMATYKDSFDIRSTQKNLGEIECIKHYTNQDDVHFIRYGLDLMHAKEIKGYQFNRMGSFVRATPDYIVIGKQAKLVEAKCGGTHIKMKRDDLNQYFKWNIEMPVEIFCFSTTENEFSQVTMKDLTALIKKNKYPKKTYWDNDKEYYEVPYSDLKPLNQLK